MVTPEHPTNDSGNKPRKAPPPIPVGQGVSNNTPQPQETNSGFGALAESVRRLIPSFQYRVTTSLRRPAISINEIATAIQNRLPGCEITIDENKVVVVRAIDRFLNQGQKNTWVSLIRFVDKWIWWNWFFREVNTRITIENSNILVADVDQRPSAISGFFVAICIPLCCLGWFAIAKMLITDFLGKLFIQASVQRLLNDVAR
jgi:hypothetical protein